MTKFWKKIGAVVLSLALMASLAVPCFAAEETTRGIIHPDNPVRIENAESRGRSLNAFATSLGNVGNQTNVTIYDNVTGDPCQKWDLFSGVDDNHTMIYLHGTSFVIDCSSSNNVQLYNRNTGNVNDQYLRLVDEHTSTQVANTFGFVLTRTITTSTPLAVRAMFNAPVQGGYDVRFASPDSTFAALWVVNTEG